MRGPFAIFNEAATSAGSVIQASISIGTAIVPILAGIWGRSAKVAASLVVGTDRVMRWEMFAGILARCHRRSHFMNRTASHALVLTPSSHPASIGVISIFTPVLGFIVAINSTHSRAAVILVHLLDAVVPIPAALRIRPSVAIILGVRVAVHGVRFKARCILRAY